MNLSGKTVFITGATKGLGRALALKLDAKGCQLLLVARDTALLAALQQALQTPGSQYFSCDLSDSDARARLAEQILDVRPHLDLLIHCAGVGSHSKLDQLTAEEIRLVLQVNTLAPLELTAKLLPLLPPGKPAGIVAIGSLAGELTIPGMSLYSASKAALHAFSRAVGFELADKDHFSLLVILGALRGTRFMESIRHPAESQRGWYRRLDTEPTEAAALIIRAIEQRRSRLVIPAWYGVLLSLSRLLAPLTVAATRLSYRKFRATER